MDPALKERLNTLCQSLVPSFLLCMRSRGVAPGWNKAALQASCREKSGLKRTLATMQRSWPCSPPHRSLDPGVTHLGVSLTMTSSLGDSPSISGAYSASTRDGGRLNCPGLFKRSVYSSVQRPLGTNS